MVAKVQVGNVLVYDKVANILLDGECDISLIKVSDTLCQIVLSRDARSLTLYIEHKGCGEPNTIWTLDSIMAIMPRDNETALP